MHRIGVDIGGTFTDCIVLEEKTGSVKRYKTPSTPPDYWRGVINVLQLAADDLKASLESFLKETEVIVHGTTIATNLILSRGGKDVGLVTTKGFRDMIEFWWKEERRFDMKYPPPDPPCPRRFRIGVEERIDFSGKVLKPLKDDDVERGIELFKKSGVDTIAVSLLFSPLNPCHEKRIAEIFKEKYPQASVHLSFEVLPQLREYERTMAMILNAYVAPYASKYVTQLRNELKRKGYQKNLLIMQSNSGVASVEEVSRNPVRLVLSGPSSGPLAGIFIAELAGESNILTIDMGGTSFDVCLIKEKTIPTTTEGYIGRFRLALPTVDVHSIGAGGGSIAWIDPGEVLHVGPMSAAAVPGPACYGQGGTEPTVTDANLVLGYLNPNYFLGGKIRLNTRLAEEAISNKIAKKLNMSLVEAAQAIINVVNNNMVDGIETVSVKRGYDPREFTLVAAGGAGPVHAAKLAQIAGISKVVVPRVASAFCAFGMAISDLRHDYVRPYISPTRKADVRKINGLFEEMEKGGHDTLRSEDVKEEDIDLIRSIDMRYIGQIYEVETPIPRESLSDRTVKIIEDRFHENHELLYGYSDRKSDVETVHLRVKAIGKTKRPTPRATKLSSRTPSNEAMKETRKAFFEEREGYLDTKVYSGEKLAPGNAIKGPSIVEEFDTTIVVFPNCDLSVEKYRNYVMTLGKGK